jgi:hypothetical protein
MKKMMILPAALLMCAAIPASASSFSSDAYYVGVEDHSGRSSDYDYNDYVFTLTGSGLTLSSGGTLSNPVTPNDNGNPFWDNLSADGANRNFGNCLYTAATNACTGGSPINPAAKYLSSGGASVAFEFFGATGAVSFTSDAALHSDNDTLDWCNSGGCTAITGSSFTPGSGDFWFKLVDSSTSSSYTSTNAAQNGIYNFAVALDPQGGGTSTPEPVSFLLAGTGLIGIYFVRRHKGSR